MQLETLKSFTPQVAERVLTSAALVGVWDEVLEKSDAEYRKEAEAVIDEIRAKLKINPSDTSVEARARVDEELSKIIDATLLGEAEFQSALDRAGREGRLSSGAYRIEFNDNFKTVFKPLGERNGPVKRMVVEADDQQHLFLTPPNSLPNSDDPEGKEPSLFVRHWRVNQKKQHWVIIQTHRTGATLVVQAVWRLLPGVIDISTATEPKDLLRAFVEHYGLKVSVLGKASKFTEFAVIKGDELSVGTAPNADIIVPPGRVFTVFNTRREANKNETMVGNVYSIDIATYAADLKRILGNSLV